MRARILSLVLKNKIITTSKFKDVNTKLTQEIRDSDDIVSISKLNVDDLVCNNFEMLDIEHERRQQSMYVDPSV